jgi:hypothetical protein
LTRSTLAFRVSAPLQFAIHGPASPICCQRDGGRCITLRFLDGDLSGGHQPHGQATALIRPSARAVQSLQSHGHLGYPPPEAAEGEVQSSLHSFPIRIAKLEVHGSNLQPHHRIPCVCLFAPKCLER